MTQATNKASTTDAREASMSRVQTQDTVLASLSTPAASEQATEKVEDKQNDGETKAKKSPQERIVELAHKRREAEEKASQAERRASELEAELRALRATAKPIEAGNAPERSKYATDAEYIEALTDYKAMQALAKREREQADARRAAEQAEISQAWTTRQEQTMARIPDYTEVVGKSELVMPDHVTAAILESEKGPELAYYFALHPKEAQKIMAMRPVQAVKQIAKLEEQLSELDSEPEAKVTPKPKPKAPEPITPVRTVPSGVGTSSTNSFEDYRARRLAQKK